MGAQWLSGRVLDSRPRGRLFEPHLRHCVVSLSKNINLSLVLVQPRNTCPFITEKLLMGPKESNHANKITVNVQNMKPAQYCTGFIYFVHLQWFVYIEILFKTCNSNMQFQCEVPIIRSSDQAWSSVLCKTTFQQSHSMNKCVYNHICVPVRMCIQIYMPVC